MSFRGSYAMLFSACCWLILALQLLIANSVDGASVACVPAPRTNRGQCQKRITGCATLGIPMKFTGIGCRFPKRKRARDGGCQCDGYCGYLCSSSCIRDSQCYWRADLGVCFNRASNLPGRPIGVCVPPTASPTRSPTLPAPSVTPSSAPSKSPVRPSSAPSRRPSRSPSTSPSKSPSKTPIQSSAPSKTPSRAPSTSPSRTPSKTPVQSSAPSKTPSVAPSRTPSKAPSQAPSVGPSRTPSISPSRTPSKTPVETSAPSANPSRAPSTSPSRTPSTTPSRTPSRAPSQAPSGTPSTTPSRTPSHSPSRTPSTAPSTTPSFAPVPVCFHASSEIELESGEFRRLDQLRYGDRVLASAEEDTGAKVFSPVIAFTGIFPHAQGGGVEVVHEHGSLILSHIHLIRASPSRGSEAEFVQARTLTNESIVFFDFKPSRVLAVREGVFRGWFTPLTETGTVVVNGLTASCHTGPSHEAARAVYAPLNWYLRWFPHTKGVLPEESEEWFSVGLRRTVIGSAISAAISNLL